MRLIIPALLTILLAPFRVEADNDVVPPITDAVVKKECGECHLAFQPKFLPGPSWKKIMANLADHFGEDASLRPDVRERVEAYLVANADDRRVDPNNPPIQITKLFWFRDEHGDADVKKQMRKLKLKSIVDCVGCHKDADRGYYD
jgi:hypothetical protein